MDTQRHDLAGLIAPEHTMVLVIDVQPVFTAMPLSPPLAEVLPRLRAFLDTARACGVPRTFIRQVMPEEEWTEVWQRQHPEWAWAKLALAPGSLQSAFDPRFTPEPGDDIVIKTRYSAFVGTNLAAMLRERGIRTVIAVGLTTDICVSSTVRDAFHHEFHTVTLSDCTAEQTLARHEAGLASLAANFGTVCTADDAIAAWRGSSLVAPAAFVSAATAE